MSPPAKVLVVDDNSEDIELVRSILQPAGYIVSSAADARLGLDMSSRERFDVVLLDNRFINSPVVGIALVAEFAVKVPGGVVMVTAFGDEELEKDARLLGSAAYLAKPYEPEKLLQTVTGLALRP